MAHLILLWMLSLGMIDVRVVLRDGSAMHLKSWVFWLMGRYRCRHRISILQVRNTDAMVTVPCIKCGKMLKSNPLFGPPVIPADVELTPHGIISGTVDQPRVKGNDMGICVKCGTATQDQSIIGGRWRYECDECCYGKMIRKAEREKDSVRLPQSVERDAVNGQNSNGAHDVFGLMRRAEEKLKSWLDEHECDCDDQWHRCGREAVQLLVRQLHEAQVEEKSKFMRTLGFAMKEMQGSSAWSMDRNRPYDGQPHTDDGKRGKTIVAGLTMRDVQDCFVMGFLRASGSERKNPVRDDLYLIDLDQIDPVAAIQCAMCEIEKMMGIFPNVPKLTYKPNAGHES